MSDAFLAPPHDHGSDRYDYFEVQAPAGVEPSGRWLDELLESPACMDCRANLFLHYEGGEPALGPSWHLTVAHDDGCPHLERLT